MTKDEQARARLVEIALEVARKPDPMVQALADPFTLRQRAGMKDPKRGHWCAAGLTAAMDIAGLVVPAPGTPARRGAVALLDWVVSRSRFYLVPTHDSDPTMNSKLDERRDGILRGAQPGDIIAWLQYPPGKDPAGWRRGHVALIVAVDDESITTVGWNEGAAPGRVLQRRLWRDPERLCDTCKGRGILPNTTGGMGHTLYADCPACKHPRGLVPRSSTVLHRKPNGMLYGIARPVAR